MNTWTEVITAEEVTAQVLDAAEEIYDGWFADEERIDWHDFLDRLERMFFYDLGSSTESDAIKAIKKHVRKIKREQ